MLLLNYLMKKFIKKQQFSIFMEEQLIGLNLDLEDTVQCVFNEGFDIDQFELVFQDNLYFNNFSFVIFFLNYLIIKIVRIYSLIISQYYNLLINNKNHSKSTMSSSGKMNAQILLQNQQGYYSLTDKFSVSPIQSFQAAMIQYLQKLGIKIKFWCLLKYESVGQPLLRGKTFINAIFYVKTDSLLPQCKHTQDKDSKIQQLQHLLNEKQKEAHLQDQQKMLQ